MQSLHRKFFFNGNLWQCDTSPPPPQGNADQNTIRDDGSFIIASRQAGELSEKDAKAVRQLIMVQTTTAQYNRPYPGTLLGRFDSYAEAQGRGNDQAYRQLLASSAKDWVLKDRDLRRQMINSGISDPVGYMDTVVRYSKQEKAPILPPL
jgi:hypothetical protein